MTVKDLFCKFNENLVKFNNLDNLEKMPFIIERNGS